MMRGDAQALYEVRHGDEHMFSQLTRIKLVQALMERSAHGSSGGCGIKVVRHDVSVTHGSAL